MIHRDVNVEAVLGPVLLPTVLAGVDEEVREVYGLNMIHNIRLVVEIDLEIKILLGFLFVLLNLPENDVSHQLFELLIDPESVYQYGLDGVF